MALKNRRQEKTKKRTGNRSEYWQECGKKLKYTTKKAAENAAAHVKRERGVHCRIYHCVKYCGKWHITADDF
jgi:hypothetical protein